MPDPINARNTGPVPPSSLPPLNLPVGDDAPAANTGMTIAPVYDPGAPVGQRMSAASAAHLLDTFKAGPKGDTWEPDAAAALRDEPVAETPRELAPETKKTLDRWFGGIFAPGRSGQSRVLVAPPPVFDPSSASRNDDGSLVPPDGRPLKNAPGPGQGAVTPPGLDRGNSVVRYGQGGSPSNFTVLDQGSTNGCGTTSLAMMLNFMAGGKQAFTRESVDAAIRHFDMFTSPGEIAAFARRRGLEATISSGTTLADLRRTIDQGLPVQVLLDVSDEHDGSGLHYEVVTGYGMGPDGKPYVELVNPWGMREYMAEDAFMARWSDLSAKGFPLGINRVAIAMKPKGSAAVLPSSEEGALFDSGMTSLRVARGLTQVTSGWARKDAATLTAGVVRLVFGGIAAIPALLGHAGRKASTRYMDEGLAQLKQPGGFWAGLGKAVVGGAGTVVCGVVEGVGNVLNRGFDLLAGASYSAVRTIGNWFRKA